VEKHVSPVAIDLGAKHTGVFLAHYPSGTDPAEGGRSGHLITAPDGGKQWSQQGRTAKRHQRRGYKRAKLAKRLLRVILTELFKLNLQHPMAPNQTAGQWFDGLLNNRGYTYLADEINKELLAQSGVTIVHLRWPKEFPEQDNLFNRLQFLSDKLDVAKRLISEFLSSREFFKAPAVQELMAEHFPEKEEVKRQQEIYSEARDAIDRLVKAEQEGHRRRQDYLDNIRADIYNHPELSALLNGTSLTADTFANLIGHISNLQLRPLRRYFNDPSMSAKDRWDEERMAKYFWNYIESWRTQEEKDKATRKALLARRHESILKVWLETHPALSVPPFEDQDNRRPPRCQSLLLDPARLDAALPNWKTITRKLLAADPGLDEELENRPAAQGWPMEMPKSHPWRGDDNQLAHILQRALDRSRERDPYCLRLLASIRGESEIVSQSAQNGRAEIDRHIGTQHTGDFVKFASAYYAEARDARDGSWDHEDTQGLLRRCDLHPPRKSKQRERLIGAIIGCELLDAGPLRDYLKSEKIGRPSLLRIAKRAANAQKENGNALKEIYQSNHWLQQSGKKPENKDVLKLFDDSRLAAERIGNWLKQDPKGWENYASPFSLAQIYNILETDIHGFSSTCQGCARENAWRSRVNVQGVANASRLPADSVRPFDGVLRRLLDTQAHEIARRKVDQITQAAVLGTLHIPILIEENRFQFAEGLAEIKKSAKKKRDLLHKMGEEQAERWLDKDERIKAASQGICAYTGKPLGKDGQLDHIVPQSETKKWQGTAYNSEANLIYVSTRGNTDKGKRTYNLEDLKPNYLTNQFGTKDTDAIAARIETTLRPYFDKHKGYTSFLDLAPEEQLCLRHALFAPNLRREAMKLLSTQTKARVNGTQKWFARRIIQHLKHALAKNPNAGLDVTYSIHRISAEDVHHARNVLAAAEPVYQKTSPQPAASHVVDATLAFACGLQDPQLADVLTWPLDDDLEQQTGWLTSLVPATIGIHSLQSKSKYRKPNPAGQKLFKDGLYGERFVPLLIDKKGKLAIGFEPKPNSWIPISKGEEQWFELLRPFLRFQNKPLEGSFSEWQQRARDSGRSHLYFTIDKPAAFDHLYKVAKQPADEASLQQADLLDGLRYIVQKKNLQEALTKDNGKKFKERQEVLKESDFEITVAFAGGNLPRTLDKPKGKVTLPARRDWERLLGAEVFKKRFGGETKDFDWRVELSKIFPSAGTNRRHHAVRKDFSLPIIPDTSGRFRVKRKTPTGDAVWQLLNLEGFSAQGFEIGADGGLGDPSALPFLTESLALVPDGGRYQEPAQQVCYFDDWREIKLDPAKCSWITGLYLAPGSQDRFRVRITMPFHEFSKRVISLLDNTQVINSHQQLLGVLSVPPEKDKERHRTFKEQWIKKLAPSDHGGLILGYPRTKITVLEVGERITFEYEDGKTKDSIKRAKYVQVGIPVTKR